MTAQRIGDDGSSEEIPAKRLQIGDLVLVRPGEVIPADGLVEQGHSAVNEAMLTGEQMPQSKLPELRFMPVPSTRINRLKYG